MRYAVAIIIATALLAVVDLWYDGLHYNTLLKPFRESARWGPR